MKITPLCLVLFGIAVLVVSTAAMPAEDLDGGISKHPPILVGLEDSGSLSTDLLPKEAGNLVAKSRKKRDLFLISLTAFCAALMSKVGEKLGELLTEDM